jgi:hypothetical protein
VTDQWEGTIARLAISRGDSGSAAAYRLELSDGGAIDLNERIGAGFEIQYQGSTVCRHCGREGRRSFGGGYCYDCFTTLARCDLCVVSPDRCHYHEGTCREPEWGETFCMTPHRVYLANTSGLKVGITRCGGEVRRWLDQGAIQGLVVLDAITRRAAGLAEVMIARMLPDRTDPRKMLRADVPELDLPAAAQRLFDAGLDLPEGVTRIDDRAVERLRYPLPNLGSIPDSVRLEVGDVRGNLLGMKGQYLVFTDGALNVRHCVGYRVRMQVGEPFANAAVGEQLGLF